MTLPAIGFAGLTHLGIVSAAAAAAKGFHVTGFDPDQDLVARLDRRELPIAEPGLDALIASHAARLRFADKEGALRVCDVVYIATDVPTDESGDSDLSRIRMLVDRVRASTRPDATIVILSQVPPGFTRGYASADARVNCQVETLVFGQAVERALHPERIIVGCADPARSLPAAWRTVLDAFGCPVLPMRFESAEIAKISINMCLVAAIGVANTMAELCETIGADWSEISPALRLDRRIGPHAYLKPGLGLAGGNLERDLATVVRLAEAAGTDAGIVRAWIANSRRRREWAYDALHRLALTDGRPARVAVLGLAYKENTHSTRNSPALALIERLRDHTVVAYDPLVSSDAAPGAGRAASALDAVQAADALAVMTPWPEFATLDPAALARRMRGRVVVDPYRVLDGAAFRQAGFVYATLGAAPASIETAAHA